MIAHDHTKHTVNRDAFLVFLAAFLGRLPALGAWWNRDDWGLLARASGLIEGDAPAVRWLSQVAYWDLLLPVFGLDPDPWTWTRLLLHGAVAALVVRLAHRLDLGSAGAWVAGLLVVVTPLAYTPTVWAAGVQELLGAVLALGCLERLLAGGARNAALATVAGVGAIASKESALLLPVLVAGIALLGDRESRTTRLWVATVLAMAAMAEAILVLERFPRGAGRAYETSLRAFLPNLTQYGWWMIAPVPSARWTPLIGAGGLALWSLWGAYAWRLWRDDDRRPAALLAAALLSLAPALPLATHVFPYLAYLPWAAAALAIAGVATARIEAPLKPTILLGSALLAAALAWTGTSLRLKHRGEDGLLTDPTSMATALSHHGLQVLRELPGDPDEVILLQPQSGPAGLPVATRLYGALAGDLGPALGLPEGPHVRWATSLTGVSREAVVLADDDIRMRWWGPSIQARLHLVLTRVGQSRPDEAVDLMLRTLVAADETVPMFFDENLMTVPIARIRAGAPAFLNAARAASPDSADTAALVDAAEQILRMAGALPDAD